MLIFPFMVLPEGTGSSNDGPGDPDGTRRRVQAHVLLAAAFGLAMALTFALFFAVFHFVLQVAPAGPIADFFSAITPNIFYAFLYGLVFGTFIAFVYNGLTTHHFNIFNTDAEDFA